MDEHPGWQGGERRREPRARTDAAARHRLANHADRGWGSSRLEDVSRSGAGFVLFGPPWPRYESEQELLMELEADPSSGGLSLGPLRLQVRNSGANQQGWLRVGGECATPEERETLAAWLRYLGIDDL